METNKILEKIKSEDVRMTPRRFFVMKWAAMLVISLFFLGLAIYLFAYITFLFVNNGLMLIPLWATGGLEQFIVEIPWTLVFLGLLSIFLFSISSKTFYRLYKKPLVTSILIILIIIMIMQIIFSESGAMKFVKQEAYNMHFQLAPDKLLEFRDSQTGSLVFGYVVATTSKTLTIHAQNNQDIELFSQENLNLNDFQIGRTVNAYVERTNGKLFIKSIEIVE